jgi:hypothetical protein
MMLTAIVRRHPCLALPLLAASLVFLAAGAFLLLRA